MDNRDEVREFLMSRRAKVTPGQAGIPGGLKRRVPGLRRTEVALLDLARTADGIPTSGRARRRATKQGASRPQPALGAGCDHGGHCLRPQPAAGPARHECAGPRLLRAGDRRRRPHPQPGALPVPGSGLPRVLPRLGRVRPDVRGDHARRSRPRPHDRGLQNLVGELSTRSETFRTLWGAHDVRSHGSGTKRFVHPEVGELVLAYEELAITAEPGLVLMIYTAEPGTPSAEKLRLLASLATEQTAAAALQREDLR